MVQTMIVAGPLRRGQIEAAAVKARHTDHAVLHESHRRFDQASHDLRAVVRSARSAEEQRRWLHWTAAGGLLAGVLLWSLVPGLIARTMPESWRLPERMAARTLRLDMWGAGERMLAQDEPERWQTALYANRIVQENREAIIACRRAAERLGQPARCVVAISR